jgi:transcriptional regulator with XRE-family HTH domain
MTEVPDPAVSRRRLRLELRRARDEAKRTQADVASAMDWSPSKLIRIERGDVGISSNDLKALLSYYGVEDKERVDELVELARSARGSSYYDQFADLLKPGFTEYLAYEGSASIIRQYDPVLVPGLLQTEEYARALFVDEGDFDSEMADRLWKLREHRQRVHDKDDPPKMEFVLDEGALRRHIGGRHVMRRQLERLREFAEEPHIRMQILPFSHGAHPGLFGNFILLEFDDPDLDDLVHLEFINSITIQDDIDLISRYVDRFHKLQKLALSPNESINFLDALIREMSSNDQLQSPTSKEAH